MTISNLIENILYENNLNQRAMDKPLGVDDIVETMLINEELKKAIQILKEEIEK